jgi:hypothetical protein
MINYEDLTISQIRKDPTILKILDVESLHRFQGGLAQTQGRVMRLINNPEHESVTDDEDLIHLKQAAKMLCVSPDTLYRHPKEYRKLRTGKGKHTRFSKAAIRAYIKRELAKD